MKKKRIIKGILIAVFAFLLLNIIAVPIVYECIFAKPHSYTVETTPGIYDYNEYGNAYPREEITYSMGDHNLMGYSYLTSSSEYLVVTVHGIKDNADTLLPENLFFLENGYNVFSFDMSGCGKSEGHIQGFTQGLIDLDGTLKFLNSDSRYKDFKKLLFGFSAGGFAVTSVLAKNPENVYGVVSVSGYNDSATLIGERGFDYAGPLVYIGRPVVLLQERIKFGDEMKITGRLGIEASSIPVFLAHGTEDKTIPYSLSVLHQFENSTRVSSYIDSASHSGILYSKAAREYQQEVKNTLKKTKKEEKASYIKTVDDSRYSELNTELFDSVLSFYENCKK